MDRLSLIHQVEVGYPERTRADMRRGNSNQNQGPEAVWMLISSSFRVKFPFKFKGDGESFICASARPRVHMTSGEVEQVVFV